MGRPVFRCQAKHPDSRLFLLRPQARNPIFRPLSDHRRWSGASPGRAGGARESFAL